MRWTLAATLVFSLMTHSPAGTVETGTPEIGRRLFESLQLGTTKRSCATCHPDGKGLEKVGDFNDQELKDIINACIRDALHGTPFAAGSQELDALLRQVRLYQR